MSDTTELEKHIKTQREEYASLKKEVEFIRSENVTTEYIQNKWEELKRRNKVISPPDTSSPTDDYNSDKNTNPLKNIDENMEKIQTPNESEQSNIDQSEQSNIDQSEQSNIDQSEQYNIDQSEQPNLDQSEQSNLEHLKHSNNIVQSDAVVVEIINQDISEDKTDNITCDTHSIQQEVDKTEYTTKETINELNLVEYASSNDENPQETILYTHSEEESQKIEDEPKNGVSDQINTSQNVDINEDNLNQSEHSNVDQSQLCIVDQSELCIVAQSELCIVDQSERCNVDQSERCNVDQSEQISVNLSEQSSLNLSEQSSMEKKESLKKESILSKRVSIRSKVKSIMTLWNFVAHHRYASLFLKAVTDKMAPGYSSVVHRKTDLSKLLSLVENGNLEDSMHFQHEMMLMFTNAIFYNSADDDISRFTMEIFDDYLEEQQRCVDLNLMEDSNFVNFKKDGDSKMDADSSVVELRSSRSRELSTSSPKRRRHL